MNQKELFYQLYHHYHHHHLNHTHFLGVSVYVFFIFILLVFTSRLAWAESKHLNIMRIELFSYDPYIFSKSKKKQIYVKCNFTRCFA
jgi:hypothetical protein